jgi:hypothetical protein
MGVRQRGASTAKISRPRHAVRRPAVGRLSGQVDTAGRLSGHVDAMSAAGALGAWSIRLAPPLTPLTASDAPSHATSIAS